MKYLILTLIIFFTENIICQITLIPDTAFEQTLISLNLDTPPLDGSVPTINIDTLSYLNVSNKGIYDLSGIEDFTALEELDCQFNFLSTLNTNQNTNLKVLHCSDNQITSLNINQNYKLTKLISKNNPLGSLLLSNDTLLNYIDCRNNQLNAIDVTNNKSLYYFNCSGNQLSTLDISMNPLLGSLFCFDNSLTQLSLLNNLSIWQLYCFDNQLTDLDLNQNINLQQLLAYNNNLFCLNVNNGNNINISMFNALNNQNLYCIEVDDSSYSINNWSNVDSQSSYSENCYTTCLVGNKEIDYSKNIDIFPNPTDDYVIINNKVSSNSFNKIKIYNSLGIEVYNYVILNNRINTLNLNKGTYFLYIEVENNIVIKKIIKN